MIGAEESERFLLCRIGPRFGALALGGVREIMRPLPVEPIKGTPLFVLGLAIIRGIPTPVIDASQLVGSTSGGPSPSRFVSLNLGERSAALAVDAVLDVRPIPPHILANIPPLLHEAGADLVATIGVLDASLLLVLEAARMVPDSVWSAIDAPGTVA